MPASVPESSTVRRSSDGDAKSLRRYFIRHVRWPYWRFGSDTIRQHWKGVCFCRVYHIKLFIYAEYTQDASIFEAVHGSAPDIAGS